MENVVFSPRSKSPNAEPKMILNSNLKSETTAFIYGWYGIESGTVDRIFRRLEDELEPDSEHVLLENIFKGSQFVPRAANFELIELNLNLLGYLDFQQDQYCQLQMQFKKDQCTTRKS